MKVISYLDALDPDRLYGVAAQLEYHHGDWSLGQGCT